MPLEPLPPVGMSRLDDAMEHLGNPLTRRGLDVARLLLGGFYNEEIANLPPLSPDNSKNSSREYSDEYSTSNRSLNSLLCASKEADEKIDWHYCMHPVSSSPIKLLIISNHL